MPEDAAERCNGVEVLAAKRVNRADEILGAKRKFGAARDGEEAFARLLEAALIDPANRVLTGALSTSSTGTARLYKYFARKYAVVTESVDDGMASRREK